MESINKQKWEELNLSRDELKTIGEALQKEEFRNLLLEYVKEINDPENRKLYEQEITQLENERGIDVKFVHPLPGYVIKTSLDGKSKAFINICSNINVSNPSSSPGHEKGHNGSIWSIPYCLAPPREDVDKKNNTCTVYDVVFHPDTLNRTNNNGAFKKLVNDTALQAVEENFHVILDKVNLKFPKLQFKGLKHPTVIRKKIENFKSSEILDIPNYPYPPVRENAKNDFITSQRKYDTPGLASNKDLNYTIPEYSIKYRKTVDMQDYTNDPMSKMSITEPKEIIITVHLPLLKCTTDASIDVTEKFLFLVSEKPAKYKLKLNLTYDVDSNRGNAKFDIVKRLLTVTLPIIKKNNMYQHVDSAREDSGVESDNFAGRSSSLSSGDEDENKRELGNKNGLGCNNNSEHIDSKTFLKTEIHYTLPNFKSQLLNKILTFTIQVSNVNPESVRYEFLNNSAGFHLTFTSMGSGFFPLNYAMYFTLPHQCKMQDETFSVEIWDNNVITQVKILSCDKRISEYFVGLDESNLNKYIIPANEALGCQDIKLELNHLGNMIAVEGNQKPSEPDNFPLEEKIDKLLLCDKINVDIQGDIASETAPSTVPQSQNKVECSSKVQNEAGSRLSKVTRTFVEEDKDLSVSESVSSFDESSSSPQRQPVKTRTQSESQQGNIMTNKSRGILKIGRSLSESSVDDYTSWCLDKIEKTKKTVRFSEVISKQVFRMNSSILGQRKKNQRKTRNKKRAQERRLSESGGESEGEIDAILSKGNISPNRKDIDVWFKEAESSSCDASDVSEISDVSESDDGQKEDGKLSMPIASKKNHRRRGKKSPRKNAATAKLQFMEN